MKIRGPDGQLYDFPDDAKDSEIEDFFNPTQQVQMPPAWQGMPTYPGLTPFGPPAPEEVARSPMMLLGRGTTKLAAAATEEIGKTASDLARDWLQRVGMPVPEGEGLIQMKEYPVTAGALPGLLLRKYRPEVAHGLDVAAGQMLSGLTEPGLLATMPLGATRPGAAYFLGSIAAGIPEQMQAVAEAPTAEAFTAETAKLGASLGMGGLLGRGLLRPGAGAPERLRYAAQERLKQEGRIGEYPGVAQVGLPPEAGGRYSPDAAARLEEKAQVLLTPAQERASSLGLGREFDWVDNFGPSDPQHLKVMQASRAQVDAEGNFVAPGRIRVSRAGMDAFMRDTAPELQQNAINSYFAEEGIHAFTTPAEAAAYAGTLTALERSIGERNYLRGSAERLTPQNLGDELLRQRMQRLMNMSTSETADAAGRERWSAQSLEFIANLIRKIRELIGTKAAKAGQEITTAMLDRISQNVEAAKRAIRAPGPTEGPPIVKTVAPGSIDPEHIVPAIRLVGGEVRPGLKEDIHEDIINREELTAKDIDQRGFSDPEGKTFFLDRDAAAEGTQLPTAKEPGRLHSTDLITAAEQPPGPTGEVSPFVRRREIADIGSEIDAAMKARGEFLTYVTRSTKWGEDKLAFEVFRLERIDPTTGQTVLGDPIYSVRAAEKPYGGHTWDYVVNRNFDTREDFIKALARYRRIEPPERPAARRRQRESMDLARRIPAMSLEQFQREAPSFNRINLQLGLNATAEEVAELKTLRDRANARYKKALDDYTAEKTDANRDELIAAMQIPQFFNEAIRKAEPVPDMPPLAPGMTRLYHGQGAAEGAGLGTSWFTKDWARAATYGDRVSFVDVPKDVADRAQASARAAGSGTASDHVLPLDWSAQAQQIPEHLQPKVYDVEEPAVRRRVSEADKQAVLDLPNKWFYSRLEKAIESLPAGEAKPKTGQQWKGWIDKMAKGQAIPTLGKETYRGGIAREEIDWVGIKDLFEDGKRYTREEVLRAVGAQIPEIQEILYGAAAKERLAPQIEVLETELKQRSQGMMRALDREWRFRDYRALRTKINELSEKIRSTPASRERGILETERDRLESQSLKIVDDRLPNERMEIDSLRGRLEILKGEVEPKYKGYKLPGGKNYSELLLTLPEEAARGMEFESGHWDPFNVLAHVRFTDRVDSKGRKILFLEEAQSDLHQQGREQGYMAEPTAKRPQAQITERGNDTIITMGNLRAVISLELPPRISVGVRPNPDGSFTARAAGRNVVFQDAQEAVAWVRREDPSIAISDAAIATVPEAYRLQVGDRPEGTFLDFEEAKAHALLQLEDDWTRSAGGAVPPFPFKDSGWKKLILRRMLAWGASRGYDGIGWTTGAQQNERWNLARHIDNLSWEYYPQDRTVYVVGRKLGDTRVQQAIPVDKLPDYIGHDLSQKITQSEQFKRSETLKNVISHGEFSGLDLEVGGKGMIGFYDQQLPNLANDIVQKYGQRVGRTEIGLGVYEGEPVIEPVHFLETPPAMREAIKTEGLPLFARRRGRPTGPEFAMPIGAGRLTRPEMAPAAEALAAREAAMYQPLTKTSADAAGDRYFSAESSPSLKDFASQMSKEFGPLKPGDVKVHFEDAFWRWAERASGAEVAAMARDSGLAKKLRLETAEGLKTIADPLPIEEQRAAVAETGVRGVRAVERVGKMAQPELFRRRLGALDTPAQRLRASTLASLAEKLIVQEQGAREFLYRKEIDPTEDLASPTIETKEPIYNEFREADQANPSLPDKLVQDARAFGGEKTTQIIGGEKVTVRKKGFPVSASKRLTAIQNKASGRVHVVSTYRDGRRGPVMVEPITGTHEKVAEMLRRYRVIASTLLDEPVKDFQKTYPSLSEYEADWGNPARTATERLGGYQPPEAFEEAVPRRTIPSEVVTPDESARIMEQILEEVPDPKSADDIKAAWEGLLVEPTKPTVLATGGYLPRPVTAEIPTPQNRIVIDGLRKLGREIMRREPNLTAEQFLDKLAQQIYESHTQAKDFEDFQRRVMEASRPPVSETARLATERREAEAAQRLEAATAARPAPLVTGARELTVPRFARRAPEELPKGEVPPPHPVIPVEPEMLSPEERAYVESEAARLHPPLKRQKVFTVDWEKFKEEDNPAALRRITGRAMEETRRIRAALAASYKRRDVMREIPATRDAADNIANDLAVNKEINVRNATSSPRLRHGDPEILAGANPVIAAKAIVPVYNWTATLRAELKKLMDGHPGINKAKRLMRDPNTRDEGRAMFARIRQESIQTMIEAGTLNAEAPSYAFDDSRLPELDGFDRHVEKGRNKAKALMQTGGWFEKMKGRAWLKATDDLTKEIAFARANWGDPKLVETAIRMRRILDQRYDRERDMGHKLKYDTSYMPGRYDGEFFNDDSVLFGPTHRLMGRLYKKNKAFRNYYEAIEEDAYIPMTRDGAAIVGHRVRQGERAIQLKAWGDSLKGLIDEATGEPVAMAPKKTPDGKFAPPSPDYELVTLQKGRDPIAVRYSYIHLINQLTDKSAVHDWPMTRFALEWAQRLKHTILLGDFFHLSRLSYYGAAIMGSKVGYRKGLTAIEYRNAADLAEAVRNGIIRQRDADWALQKIPVKIGTRTYPMSRIDLMREFEKSGLNIGRIQDALYADLVRNIPLFGRYNKWLFGRYTRGLMAQAAIVEFERIHKANPKIPVDRLVKDISRDLNQFFGSIGRQGWVRSATMQDISRMLFLAPQWVEGLVDKEVVSAARIAGTPLHAMGLYRNNLAPLGTMGRGIGRGLMAMIALTQVINLIGTYLKDGKPRPTWQNERGHEWDAWIPQIGAKGEGFYFSPLALFNELAHDLVRLIEQKPKAWDAVKQIGQNKLSPYGRLALVMATSQTPTGQYITTTPGVLGAAAQQLAPVPISFGKFMQAGAHLVAPGIVPPVKPEQIQRQTVASLGLKIEPVPQPALEMSRLATEFMKREYGKVETIHILPTTEPAYSGLRNALRNQDWRGAEKILKTLEKTHTDNDIVKAMKLSARHPFTGAKKYEGEFIDSLTPQQRELYDRAVEQKEKEYQNFLEWFSKQPGP